MSSFFLTMHTFLAGCVWASLGGPHEDQYLVSWVIAALLWGVVLVVEER